MPTKLVLDDIIFRLQAFGGASEFWTSLTGALEGLSDVETAQLSMRHVRGSQMQRLLPVVTSRDEILHSSHFRVPARPGAPCVTTIHDLSYERGVVRGRTAQLNLYERRRSVRQATSIACISDYVKADLLDFYADDLRDNVSVSTIYHGRTYDGPVGRDLSDFQAPPGGYVLFVGNRRGYKNFEAAVGGLVASNLIAAGTQLWCTGAPAEAEDYSVMRRFGLDESSIRFVGLVSREQLAQLYENAFALCYPSRSEGFGLPPLDAMSLGCPVIGARASSVQEIVGDGGILLDPDDVAGFGTALDRLADPGERNSWIEAGLLRASEFSWERAARDYLDLYRGRGQ